MLQKILLGVLFFSIHDISFAGTTPPPNYDWNHVKPGNLILHRNLQRTVVGLTDDLVEVAPVQGVNGAAPKKEFVLKKECVPPAATKDGVPSRVKQRVHYAYEEIKKDLFGERKTLKDTIGTISAVYANGQARLYLGESQGSKLVSLSELSEPVERFGQFNVGQRVLAPSALRSGKVDKGVLREGKIEHLFASGFSEIVIEGEPMSFPFHTSGLRVLPSNGT